MLAKVCSLALVLLSVDALAQQNVPAQQNEPETVVEQEPYNVKGVRPKAAEAPVPVVELDEHLSSTRDGWHKLAEAVPNLHVGTGGAGSYGDTFSIRGLTNTPFFSDPAVTVYLDDLPLGSSFTNPAILPSFTEAEVHKGPQGPAFGRSGPGGVIVLASKAPGDGAGSRLDLSAGDHGLLAAMLRWADTLGRDGDAVVSLWHAEQSGFIRNRTLGIRVDEVDESGGHARFRFKPGERSEVALQVLAQRTRNGPQPLVPLGGPFHSVERDKEGRTSIDSIGIALKGAIDLAHARLTAVTSYTNWRLDPFENHLVLPPAIDSLINQDQKTWNEEIRLASTSGGPVDWHAGLWLSRSETDGDVLRELTGLFPIEGSAFSLVARTAAAFGQISTMIGQRWEVTGGMRAEHTTRSFSRSETVPTIAAFEDNNRFDNLTANLALDFSVSKSTGAHFSISNGVKPGGYSAFTGNRDLAPFQSEHVLAFESGVHTTLAGGKLTLDATAFAYRIRDYQIERSFTATDFLVVNAPRARSLGGELGAAWRPADGWTVRGSLGVTSITLREFRDPFSGDRFDGNRAPYAPEYSASLQVAYQDPGGWFGSVGTTLTGRTYFDESENPLLSQDTHALLDARIGYKAGKWQLSLYGRNLTDTNYYTFIVAGVGHGTPGPPQNFGAEFSIEF